MFGGEQFVWDVGTLVDVGKSAERRAVDDDLILAEPIFIEILVAYIFIEILVAYDARILGLNVERRENVHDVREAARHRERLDAQLPQSVPHRLRSAARAEHKRLRVMGLQQGTDGLAKADDIGVESPHVADADDVDRPNRTGIVVEAAEKRDDILLVGNRDVQPHEVGHRLDERQHIVGRRHLKIVVASVDMLGSKLLAEILTRERVPQRLAN